ncbi:hypothetical protein THAOC_18125 [Thalassiosira oceanica]|uniref:Uncharacterized protein n=1 Tax=Thalassiosira oceanica TaxID=159749 RepID=K0SSY4_THAOC|nr:hypothetical protein THAOC_18125 [Thalassiosira oceanica]|eukprot:EJK61397.1 hypothetical protein THAOC_18125 [Thalassiosira oceanica]
MIRTTAGDGSVRGSGVSISPPGACGKAPPAKRACPFQPITVYGTVLAMASWAKFCADRDAGIFPCRGDVSDDSCTEDGARASAGVISKFQDQMRRSGREMESGWDPSKIDAKVASVLVPEERARYADGIPLIWCSGGQPMKALGCLTYLVSGGLNPTGG